MPAACLYASQSFITKNPNTTPGADQCDGARAEVAADGRPERHHQDRAGKLSARRPRAVSRMRSARCAKRSSPDGMMPDDGPRTALKTLQAFEPSCAGQADRPVEDLHQRLRQEGARRRSRPEHGSTTARRRGQRQQCTALLRVQRPTFRADRNDPIDAVRSRSKTSPARSVAR